MGGVRHLRGKLCTVSFGMLSTGCFADDVVGGTFFMLFMILYGKIEGHESCMGARIFLACGRGRIFL